MYGSLGVDAVFGQAYPVALLPSVDGIRLSFGGGFRLLIRSYPYVYARILQPLHYELRRQFPCLRAVVVHFRLAAHLIEYGPFFLVFCLHSPYKIVERFLEPLVVLPEGIINVFPLFFVKLVFLYLRIVA